MRRLAPLVLAAVWLMGLFLLTSCSSGFFDEYRYSPMGGSGYSS